MPNKGSLSQAATEMLRESGYRQRQDAKELTLVDAENGVEFYYLRPRDIALYVGEGTLDIGITGRDLLLDSGAKAEEVLSLGFGRSRFLFAGPMGEFTELAPAGRHAGSPRRTSAWSVPSSRTGASTPPWSASTARSRPACGSGSPTRSPTSSRPARTLRQAGLEVFGETILESEAVLITRGGDAPAGLEVFKRRLEGVLVARTYVMMDYDIERVTSTPPSP